MKSENYVILGELFHKGNLIADKVFQDFTTYELLINEWVEHVASISGIDVAEIITGWRTMHIEVKEV